MTMSRSLLCLFGALSLAGCGNYRTRPVVMRSYPSPTESQAVVCVHRQDDGDGAGSVPVWDNGTLVGANGPSAHFCYLAEPGRHFITSELLVTAEHVAVLHPGETYWVRQTTSVSIARKRGRPLVAEYVMLSRMANEEGIRLRQVGIRNELIEVPVGETVPTGAIARATR